VKARVTDFVWVIAASLLLVGVGLLGRFAPPTGGAQPSQQRIGDLDGIYPVLTGSDPAPQLGDVGGAIPARLV